MDKYKIAEKIYMIHKEISEYDNHQYHFNVFVNSAGDVWRGDLHINSNSYTISDSEYIYEFNLYPIFTTNEIESMGDNPEDGTVISEWKKESDSSMRRYANEIAYAIVNGSSIEDISPNMWG